MFKAIKDKLTKHLFLQYIVVSIISWILFFLVEFIIATTIPSWVFNSNLFTGFWDKQCKDIVSDLQLYVEENEMTIEEVREYNLHNFSHTKVVFCPYTNHTKEIHSRRTTAQIVCTDGVFYPKKYVPSNFYWACWNYIGIISAFILSETFMLTYLYKLLRRMKNLYTQIVSTDLRKRESAIQIEGRDELALLGQKVESMRLMLIDYLEEEVNQRKQQTQLIASLSHDIRTPLTKIITCLDILNYNLVTSEEEKENCIKMMTSKANQLKCLTDTLLNSVSQGNDYKIYQKEIYDGPSILSQLLFEGSYYLENEGLKVQLPNTISGTYQLKVDIIAMRRVADNVYSNLQKYTDANVPIRIWIEENDIEVTVSVQNHKQAVMNKENKDSHRIGLATIAQIMNEMGGRSEVEDGNQIFTLRLILPKYNHKTDYN